MKRGLVTFRLLFTSSALLWLGACTGGGVNAGEDGGIAFIVMTLMLLAIGAVLWLALGRGD